MDDQTALEDNSPSATQASDHEGLHRSKCLQNRDNMDPSVYTLQHFVPSEVSVASSRVAPRTVWYSNRAGRQPKHESSCGKDSRKG